MRRTLIVTTATVVLLASNVAWAEAPETPIRLPLTNVETTDKRQVTVARGDHLWKISEVYLLRAESDSAVAPYWRRVIDLNLATLRSGDPDLIYPGEVVLLPSPTISERP